MPERIPMTADGKARILEELNRLKGTDRFKIVREIEEARGHGDLSENAEYHAAKERQGQLEARIRLLEDQIARAEVLDPSKMDLSRVTFGLVVKVYDASVDREVSYRIVGEMESDVERRQISVKSPIAQALIGKQVGDVVEVSVPGGRRELEIVGISAEAI
jgi:transcription elongation factor GreA